MYQGWGVSNIGTTISVVIWVQLRDYLTRSSIKKHLYKPLIDIEGNGGFIWVVLT